ncbi:hypothetical protein [Thalassiella azotivora]
MISPPDHHHSGGARVAPVAPRTCPDHRSTTTSARRLLRPWAAGPLLTALLLTGCAAAPDTDPAPSGSGTGPTTAGAPATVPGDEPAPGTPAAPSASEPAQRAVTVTVTGRTVTPAPSQVDLAVGETLVVEVVADTDTEIHAHGFEVQADVPAGVPTRVELTGTAPGVYEVELHHPDLLLMQVAVR